MADIFHGKCNLQCPVLRLKSNSLSFLICLTEENRKGRGGEVQAQFLGQFSNGAGSLRGHLSYAPASNKAVPTSQHISAASAGLYPGVSHLAKTHGQEKGCQSHPTPSC